MSRWFRWVLAAALAAALAGCDAKDNDEKRAAAAYDPTPDNGDLGFVHAMTDAPTVQVSFAGSFGGSGQFDLEFGQARKSSTLAGGYNVRVTYTNTAGSLVTLYERVGEDNVKVFPDSEITVVLAGTLADPRVVLVQNQEYLYGVEDPANIQEPPQIQFVHAVAGRGRLDFYLTGSTDDLAGAAPLTLGFGGLGPLQDIEAGSGYRIRVTPAGDVATVLYDSGSTSFNLNTRALLGAFPYFGPAEAGLRVKRIRSTAATFGNEPYPAWYRAGHLVADVPEADLYLGPTSGAPVAAGLPFQAISPFAQRSRGTVTTNLTVAGSPADVLFSDSVTLRPADATSLFFAGLNTDEDGDGDPDVIGIAAIEDARAVPGYAQVVAVHGAPGGVPVNVFLLRPGEATTGREPAFGLEFGSSGSRTLGAGERDLVVQNESGTALIGPERISLSDASHYTLLLTDAPAGGSPLSWRLVPRPIAIE